MKSPNVLRVAKPGQLTSPSSCAQRIISQNTIRKSHDLGKELEINLARDPQALYAVD
jgi:hypothetical protein